MTEVNTYNVKRMPIREQKNIGAQIRVLVSESKFVRKELVVMIFEILGRKWDPVTRAIDTDPYYRVKMSDGSEIVTDAAGKALLTA
jgi:hypothetical protein